MDSTWFCKRCQTSKTLDNFFFYKHLKKYCGTCKKCHNEDGKLWKQRKAKIRKINEPPKPNLKEFTKEEMRAYKNDWYKKNREECIRRQKISVRKNGRTRNGIKRIEKERGMTARIKKDKVSNPIMYGYDIKGYSIEKPANPNVRIDKDKIYQHIRRVVICIIKDIGSESPTLKRTGCTAKYFKEWIEGQFQEGMSWDNYGNRKNTWNMDHIFPISRWNLSSRTHRRLCNHFTNLQPMWHTDNVRKKDKLEYKKVA